MMRAMRLISSSIICRLPVVGLAARLISDDADCSLDDGQGVIHFVGHLAATCPPQPYVRSE